jgi:hypothetical protein
MSAWLAHRVRQKLEAAPGIFFLGGAPAEVRTYFNVADDFSFDIDTVLLAAIKR